MCGRALLQLSPTVTLRKPDREFCSATWLALYT